MEPRLRIVVRPYGSPIRSGSSHSASVCSCTRRWTSGGRGVFGAVYELGGHGWLRASGWAALAAFVVAVYGGLAFLLEDLAGRTILPLLRRGGAREAIEHDLDAQLAGIAGEAGVRHTL